MGWGIGSFKDLAKAIRLPALIIAGAIALLCVVKALTLLFPK